MKMLNASIVAALLFGVILLPNTAQAAGNPKATFERLFGDEYDVARKSRDKEDNVILAFKLYDAAEKLKDEKALRLYILDKAYEMGMEDPKGYGAAASSLKLMSELDSKNSLKHYMTLVTLHEKYIKSAGSNKDAAVEAYMDYLTRLIALQVSKGEAVQARRQVTKGERMAKSESDSAMAEQFKAMNKVVMSRSKMDRERKNLTTALLDNPSDQEKVKALTEMLLLGYDEVKEAQAYAKHIKDPELKKFIEMSSKKPDQLKLDEVKQLADWYFSQIEKDDDLKYITAMNRTEQLYAHFAKNYKNTDVKSLEAQKNLEWLTTNGNQVPEPFLHALQGKPVSLTSTVASPFPSAEAVAAGAAEEDKGPDVAPGFAWQTAYSVYKTMISEGGKDARSRQNWLHDEVVGTMLSHDGFIDTRRGNAYLCRDLAAVIYAGETMRVSVSVEFKRGVKVPTKNRLIKIDGKITRATFLQMKRSSKVYLRIWITEADWEPTSYSRSSIVQSKATRQAPTTTD